MNKLLRRLIAWRNEPYAGFARIATAAAILCLIAGCLVHPNAPQNSLTFHHLPVDMNTTPNPEESWSDLQLRLQQTISHWTNAQQDGRPDDADRLLAEVFDLTAEASERSEDLRSVREAQHCEKEGQWDCAEAAHRKRLTLQENLENLGMLFKVHHDLSRLYRLLNRDPEAYEAARAASDAARRFDFPLLLRTALENEAWMALRLAQLDAATSAVAEALEQFPADRTDALSHARILVVRARCRVELGQYAAAQEDLDEAWAMLQPQATRGFMVGVQDAIANWWETTARLQWQQSDRKSATEAWCEAVSVRRHIASQTGQPAASKLLADALEHLSRCYVAMQDELRAREAREDSSRILSELKLPATTEPPSP